MEILNIKHGPGASEILDAILWRDRISFEVEENSDPSCLETKVSSIKITGIDCIDYTGSISMTGTCTIIKSYNNGGSIFVKANQNRPFVAEYSPSDRNGKLKVT